MKKILDFALFATIMLIIVAPLKAQQNETILAQVNYSLKHLRDTSIKNVIYQEDMILLLGKNSAAFSSYDQIKQEESIIKQKEEQKKAAGGAVPNYKFENLRYNTTTTLYHFFKDKKIITKEFLMKNYLYEEPIEKIKWKLSKDTLNISTISCKKATTNFKGRNWIVWFAPSLPFEAGPWELNGLPGLIIEAYDEKKEIQFLFGGFEAFNTNSNELNKITLPTNKILKTTKEEVNKLKTAMYADPKGFFMSYLRGSGGFVDDPNAMQSLNLKNEVKNPIVLTNQ